MTMLINKRGKLILFLEQASILLSAGITADKTFRTIGRDLSIGYCSHVAQRMAAQLEEGQPLPLIMEDEKTLFDKFDTTVIQSCWETGDLSEGFRQLHNYHKRRADLANQLRTALTYPAILSISAIIAVILLLVIVVPKFQTMVMGQTAEVSSTSELVFFLSRVVMEYGIFIALFIVGLVGISLTKAGKNWLQNFFIATPWLGDLIRIIEVEKWARGLALLLQRGVHIQTALVIGANLHSLNQMRQGGRAIAQQIRQGRNLTVLMAESGQFPDAAIQLLRTGEETGQLGIMLEKVADFLALESRAKLNLFTTIIEPLTILLLGGLVALIVLSLISITMSVNTIFL
ncbi:MAG: hypothetical protein CMM58_03440 [Rhodospirillaceae bacterium]|nr:hypothetical protein [Rhodospirillaceae bacterium]|tara:strand:- start:2992 stop:4026 length:1035 start_codon:yes stop_codon:yes gene_type:complete